MAHKKTPHLRLKKLRKIIGTTQRKLAEKCGVSYPYLLSVETGQRRMSEKLAKRISFATGVSKDWLMYALGTTDRPFDAYGTYDEKSWARHCRLDACKFPGHDFGDVGDEMLISDDAIDELGVALRAAWRLGKFNVAALMLREFVKSMEADLKLADLMREERGNDLPTEILEADLKNELPFSMSIHLLLPLLSPLAKYKFGRAFKEGGAKERTFLREMDEIHGMIKHSFSLKTEAGLPHVN
jgi:transcriptional regulator with XRE-family HTH domain